LFSCGTSGDRADEPVEARLGEDQVVAEAGGPVAVFGSGPVLLQQPGEQPDRRVVECVGDGERTGALQMLVTAFLGIPLLALGEIGEFAARGIRLIGGFADGST
jgi:hypothetical protein